jgi:hypothetical protein
MSETTIGTIIGAAVTVISLLITNLFTIWKMHIRIVANEKGVTEAKITATEAKIVAIDNVDAIKEVASKAGLENVNTLFNIETAKARIEASEKLKKLQNL